MRILHINVTANSGSTGRIVQGICKIAHSSGHECEVAFGRGGVGVEKTYYRIGGKLGILWHVLLTRAFDRHAFGSKLATRRFIIWVKRNPPDIIHLHNIHGYYLNLPILFKYLLNSGIPIVWTLHDCWPITGHCAYFDLVNCSKWKKICQKCPQINAYPASWGIDNSKDNFIVKKTLFNKVKNLTIVPVSDWLQDRIQESFMKETKQVVIKNGINLELFKGGSSHVHERYGLEQKKIILGVASIWEKRKGLDEFLKLARLITSEYIIVLVGLNRNQMSQIESYKNMIGISRTENVEELVEFYRAALVFFNPTLEDNYPTTNLEAIACGTPVITYQTGGSVESVTEKAGFVVDKYDVMHTWEIIQTISKEDWDCELLRKYALDNFNQVKKFQDYLLLYNSLLSSDC